MTATRAGRLEQFELSRFDFYALSSPVNAQFVHGAATRRIMGFRKGLTDWNLYEFTIFLPFFSSFQEHILTNQHVLANFLF